MSHAQQMVMENIAEDRTYVNVSYPERWVSAVAGTALAAYGLTRRSIAGFALAGLGGAIVMRAATGHCQLYRVLGISTAKTDGDRRVSVPYGRGIRVEKSVTVNASPDELYRFWRDFENLPRLMSTLDSVKILDEKRSHRVAKGPMGT